MLLRPRFRTAWFAKDDGEEEGPPGGGGGDHAAVAAGLAALKAKHGDTERALAVLYDENYRLREKSRKLKEKLDEAQLPEGAVVISKEEAATLAAYKKLGAPDQVVEKSKLDEAEGKLNQVDRERLALSAATRYGYEPSVLADLVKDKALHLEAAKETVDGKTVDVFKVRPLADEKAPLKALDAFVTESLASYLPALQVKKGTSFPVQPAAEGSNGSTSYVDKFIEQRNKSAQARPNPLATAATKE